MRGRWSSRSSSMTEMEGDSVTQLRLFAVKVTAEMVDKISGQRGITRRNKHWLSLGVNPGSGERVAQGEETCGSCGHLVVRRRNRTYFKCGLVPMTFGPGTDIRKKWPACVKWVEKEET